MIDGGLSHLDVARREIGVIEDPEHPNAGTQINAYQRETGNSSGDAWCMSFVVWCLTRAYKRPPFVRSGRCHTVYLDAKAKGLVRVLPQPGMIFLKWYPSLGRYAHTGFLLRRGETPGTWVTIEGNTNPNGGRDGYGVFQRTRTFTRLDRFLLPVAPDGT